MIQSKESRPWRVWPILLPALSPASCKNPSPKLTSVGLLLRSWPPLPVPRVVEVLSDSTEGHDRGEKFAHYRRLASLQEYVLVSQRAALVEVYRRNEAGRWELYEYRSGEQAELVSVGAKVEVDEIYRDPLMG